MINKGFEKYKIENKNNKNNHLIELINKLNNRMDSLEKENLYLKNEISEIKNNKSEICIKQFKKLEKELLSDIKNYIKNEISKLEIQNLIKEIKSMKRTMNIFHYNTFYLKHTKTIKNHLNNINKISLFPNGNIISVSSDKSIKIYDQNFSLINNIENAHDDCIRYISILDNENFITCSDDKSLKIWKKNSKKNNTFELLETISNAHKDRIDKVIYLKSKKKIISCSDDSTIKIWEKAKNKYQCINTILNTDSCYISSILEIPDKNLLISGGGDGVIIWDIINYKKIKLINNAFCSCWNAMKKFDEERIIVGGGYNGIMKVININDGIVVKDIKNYSKCWGILVIDNGVFFTGGEDKAIRIYRIDNYENISIIKNAHDSDINGFCFIKDGLIVSYSHDKNIKIWIY